MTKLVACIGLVLLLVVQVAAEDETEPTPATPAQRLASLAWLEGRWSGAVGPGTWEAVYTGVSGGEVLSTNKEIRQDRVVSFEFERFHVDGERVVMTPYVNGVKSVAFGLTTCDAAARRAVFENPAHDFPQRIDYHRAADDRLVIRVTAERDGKTSGFVLELTRK